MIWKVFGPIGVTYLSFTKLRSAGQLGGTEPGGWLGTATTWAIRPGGQSGGAGLVAHLA